MRRPAFLLGVLALLGGAAVLVLSRDASGPFPSAAAVRAHGFAAWPVDTVEEAERECADAEEWRLEARATALRFAREVLGYPDPTAGETFGEERHHYRLSIGTNGVEELFLGSVIEVDRYGRCWYVTYGIPREGELDATLGFVYREGRPHLLLGHPLGLPRAFVGFGDWETQIDPGLRQTVIPLPGLDEDATGHAVYATPNDRGISEGVGAQPLPPVPSAPEGPPAASLDTAAVVDDRDLCRIAPSSRRSPEAAIRYLFEWRFPELLVQRRGFPFYERRRFHHLGGDRWRVLVDDAVLDATIPSIGDRCHAIVSLEPAEGDAPLRRLWVEDGSVTFGVDWGGGDEVLVGFASPSGGAGGTLKQIREPVTFAATPGGGPAVASAVLYKDGHVVSAFYGLFDAF